MIARLSLRARLIVGVIALAAGGLAVADVATYTSLRSFLVSRTDSSLDSAHASAEGALRGPGHGRGGPAEHDGPGTDRLTASVPGLYVQLRRFDGTVVQSGAAPQFSGSGRRRRRSCRPRSQSPTGAPPT